MRWRVMGFFLGGGGGEVRGGGVDIENLQVVIWKDKFHLKKLCVTCFGPLDFNGGDDISCKDDNSTLSPTFPVSYSLTWNLLSTARWVSWMVHTSMSFGFRKF